MKTQKIIDRLYPARPPRKRRFRIYLRRIARWAKRHSVKLAMLCALLLAWVIAHIYYYNKLIDMEYNIQAAWAQVEAEQQRRYHIQQDVTRLVVGYATHERDLMTNLTELRTWMRKTREVVPGDSAQSGPAPSDPASGVSEAGNAKPSEAGPGEAERSTAAPSKPGAEPPIAEVLDGLTPAELNKVFPQIMLTAEQYPSLRLTENFQQFSAAIIDTETRITEHLEQYNQRVNEYTTLLKQFPGNIFGAVWGFEDYEFFIPDREIIQFRPVEYTVAPRPGEAGN